jgi:hypothetical protein
MQKEEDDVVDDKKRPHTSLWQWIVQNDIVILILVGIIMVVITRASHSTDESSHFKCAARYAAA